MKRGKEFIDSALTKQNLQVAFGVVAVAIAAYGRAAAICTNAMLSPFVLGNALLEGVLSGLDKTDDTVLDGELLAQIENELENDLLHENPEAFSDLKEEISVAFEIQAKRFEKALQNLETNTDRSEDFLNIINREGLALDRLGKDYLLHSSHGELFKWAIGGLDTVVNGMSTAASIYLINISKLGKFIGYSIGKTISSYDDSLQNSKELVCALYGLPYILQEFRGVNIALLKKFFYQVTRSSSAGALEGLLAPSEEQLKAFEDISLKVTLGDIKEFAILALKDFVVAYRSAQKKFSKYDQTLEGAGVAQVFRLNPLKAEDESMLRGRQALLTREKYKPIASVMTTVKSGIYASKAVVAKHAYGASKGAVKTAAGAVLKAREKLQQSTKRQK